MLTTSKPENVTEAGTAKAAATSEAMLRVSVPDPPEILSKELRVAPVPEMALKVSGQVTR